MANAKARELGVVLTDAERKLWALLRDRQLLGTSFGASGRSGDTSRILPASLTA